MGEERTGKRKLLLFFLACSLSPIFSIAGCTPLHQLPSGWVGDWHLSKAKTYLRDGEYDKSLAAAQEVLIKHYQTTGDQALFQMGLIFAFPENRQSDPRKSLQCFERILAEFPDSPLIAETRVLVRALRNVEAGDKKIMDLEEEIEDLIREIKGLEQVLKERDEDIGNLEKKASEKDRKIDLTESALKVAEERIKDLEYRIDEMQKGMETLKRRMERLKRVDLGIEKQKRGALP